MTDSGFNTWPVTETPLSASNQGISMMETDDNQQPGYGSKHGIDSQEDCVPVSALSQPGEDEQMNPPGVGDLVQYQKEGTVTRIEGDNAYVKVNSVNGKPITAEDAKTKNTPEENSNREFAQLKEEAAGREM